MYYLMNPSNNMEDIGQFLNRSEMGEILIDFLNKFEENKNNISKTCGIHVYGPCGSGKTTFVNNILKKLGYHIVRYDTSDTRNRNVMQTITCGNVAEVSVISMFKEKKKRTKTAIVIDEIDGMIHGEKGGLNSLIKLVRGKKTTKQKQEPRTLVPVICVGGEQMDKKLKELNKACINIYIKRPTDSELKNIINHYFRIDNENLGNIDKSILNLINGDLRMLNNIHRLYNNDKEHFFKMKLYEALDSKDGVSESKAVVHTCISKKLELNDHIDIVNEAERTIVALLWHENVIDVLPNTNLENIIIYKKLLDNICFADYIDRITFQKQVWQFNEMSSLIKTMYNNNILHESKSKKNINKNNIRFTKVLTKYSTEYNNQTFLSNLCNLLLLDKKDLLKYFDKIRDIADEEKIIDQMELLEISKLDINRMFRYLQSLRELGNLNNTIE